MGPAAPAGFSSWEMGKSRASSRVVTEKGDFKARGLAGRKRSPREMCAVCARSGMAIPQKHTRTRIVAVGDDGR